MLEMDTYQLTEPLWPATLEVWYIYSFIYLKAVNIWASLRALCSDPGPIPRLVKSYLGMRRPRVCLLIKQPENVVLLICSVQLMVEGLYVLSILEEEDARKEALLEKFTKVVVDNSDHLQPGWEQYNTTTMDRRQVVCLVVASFSLSLSLRCSSLSPVSPKFSQTLLLLACSGHAIVWLKLLMMVYMGWRNAIRR